MLLYLLLLFATNLDPIYGKAILSAASPVSLSQVNCGWLGTLILLCLTFNISPPAMGSHLSVTPACSKFSGQNTDYCQLLQL